MKKILSIIACALVASMIAQADVSLPPQVKVSRPSEITSQFTMEDAEKVIVKLRKNKSLKFEDTSYWTAFSDRSENVTYNGPSVSSGEYKKLDLGEPLFIADYKDGFALVFSQASNEFNRFPDINSSVANSYGWLPLDNLVLWDVCPMDKRGVYQKALIVSNIDEYVGGDVSKAESSQNRVFSRPDNKGKTTGVKTGQVFYVIKEDGDKVLLANTYKRTERAQFSGWVQKSAFTPWNQRSCIEQKWNKGDLQLLNGTTFDIKDEKGKTLGSISYTADRKRLEGEVFRYPVLNNDKDDKNIYKATFFSSGGSIVGGMSTNQSTSIDKDLIDRLNKKKVINLIVIIDGTSSMEQNFPAIKNALNSCMKNFDDKYNIRIGAAIYRDHADGEYITEALSVQDSKNYDKVWQFFDTGGRYGIKSSPNDHSAEEDMFAGYEVALDNKVMGYDPKESNIFIVVGDCGNPAEDEQSSRVNKIIDGLEKNNVQLIVFQTRNYGVGASQGYRMQNNKFMKENIEKQYKNRGLKPGQIKSRPDGTGREYQHSNPNSEVFFQCVSRFPNGTGTLSPNELANMVKESIIKCYDAVRAQEEILMIIGLGSNPDITDESFDMYNYLKGELGKDFADRWRKNKSTVAITGYTQIKNKDGRDLWEPVIYISNTELANLLKRLKPAYLQAREGGNDRMKYVAALEGIVKAMIPDAQTGETDISSITAMIAGLNVATKSTSADSYKIKDLLDPNVVDDTKYRKLLNDYKTKYQRLEDIQRNYKYKKQDVIDENVTYYWIPVADLP